jgi:hypothetical protein
MHFITLDIQFGSVLPSLLQRRIWIVLHVQNEQLHLLEPLFDCKYDEYAWNTGLHIISFIWIYMSFFLSLFFLKKKVSFVWIIYKIF